MTEKEKVQKWIDDGGDFNSGLALLREIGRVPNMIRIMTGRPHRYASKLKYELLKASGLNKLEVVETEVVNDPPEDNPPAGDQIDKLISVETKEAEIISGEKTEVKNQPDEKREDWKDKPAVKPAEAEIYPLDIEKIKSEYSRLYNLRAEQHGLMTEVTPDNAPANVKRRKVLSDSIAEISQRLELLYVAKELYFENGTMPDMDTLFGEVKKAEQAADELPNDIKQLKAMKKALQINIHKAKNKLEYQEETKQKRANPMPDGPKRLDLEKTIEEREKEIERIEFKIVDLAHTH